MWKKVKNSVENQFSLNFAASRRMVEKWWKKNSPLRGELVFFHQKIYTSILETQFQDPRRGTEVSNLVFLYLLNPFMFSLVCFMFYLTIELDIKSTVPLRNTFTKLKKKPRSSKTKLWNFRICTATPFLQ